MSEIYSDSIVTIAAVNSRSVIEGFLQSREVIQSVSLEWKLPDSYGKSEGKLGKQLLYLSPAWSPDKDKVRGPLTERGWAMQEGLLPNRLLLYTRHQMIWKCCKELKFERGVTRLPSKDLVDDFKTAHLGTSESSIRIPFSSYRLGTLSFLVANRYLNRAVFGMSLSESTRRIILQMFKIV
jgi:hypothetical protein